MTEVNELEAALEAGYGHGQADSAAEISALKEKLNEATERLQAIIDWADLASKHPDQFKDGGARNLTGPVFDAARAFLEENENVG
jgi:uncharacterized protein YciW